MALSTYANLKTALAAALNVPEAQISSRADDIITLAEKEIWRDLRVKEMETSLSVSTSTNVISIPSGFLDLKYATILDATSAQDGYHLDIVSSEFIVRNYPNNHTTARPRFVAVELTNFRLGPEPDTDYLINGVYWAEQTAVSTSANPVFAKYPQIYLHNAAYHAEMWLGRDERAPMWKRMYLGDVRKMNLENRRAEGYAMPHYF